MLAALTFLPRLLIDKTAWFFRCRRLERDKRRIDRLYGPLTPRSNPVQLDASAQADRLGEMVRAHCRTSAQIVEAHLGAAIKIDSAEYAVSCLMNELRGVMTKMPTHWACSRTEHDAASHVFPIAQIGGQVAAEARAA